MSTYPGVKRMLPFAPVEISRPRVSRNWCLTRDGDPQALELFVRHYSCIDPSKKWRGGNYSRFGGQGGSIVLISATGDAIFVWRKEQFRLDGEVGVVCAVFRNEGSVLSSDLIREAVDIAWERWPGERLFTHVNPRAVRGDGKCFKKAGWKKLPGRTKKSHLIVLEIQPEAVA